MDFRVPGSLKMEHEKLYEELNKASRLRGNVGMAAMLAFKTFQHHIRDEEEFAFPPLNLLPSLAEKENAEKEVSGVVKLSDTLGRRLASLLGEHDEMRKALQEMNAIAIREEKPECAALAKKLLEHMSMEEQIYYPAALLVGKYVKYRLYGTQPAALPK